MTSIEIRQRFLDYFAREGHAVVASSSLVPLDPTLLFVNAGMVQFKDSFLGLDPRPYSRAVTSQKCMRVSGKHNDLENVGPSPRHHTFFEMLGNFSFGDYFKADAIRLAFGFLTRELGVDPERLVFTVHQSDDEAYDVWVTQVGVPAERVLRMGDKTNFWMMADVGPCGPTSELHYDFGPDRCTCGRPDCSVALDNDCDRWLEVWNLVFMQYDQAKDGSRAPLPKPGVDTGMGLERICAIKQGVHVNYDTDLFSGILDHVQAALRHAPAERRQASTGYRVLADHGRAMTFLIADGVLPGNDGRNYVLRLIMRRAMRFGKQIGFEEPFLAGLVEAVIATMEGPYPQLRERADWIKEVVSQEESRFERTLETGLELLEQELATLKAAGATAVPGEVVFRLYDTYGFPPDLTRVVAEEQGLDIDRAGFQAAMAAQKQRARAQAQFGVSSRDDAYRRLGLAETVFLGYESLEAPGEVLALVVDGELVDEAAAGQQVELILDRTPFYAESGGQMGDQGLLIGPGSRIRVRDTVRPIAGLTVHLGEVLEGAVAVGAAVHAQVDADRRASIRRNHTATHLLHAALQAKLGDHAQQRGSLVAPDRLRFDFAHLKGVTADELRAVEAQVNAMILADAPVNTAQLSLEEAKRRGAMMLFGEKYGDQVRMVEVAGQSRELCGGTHVAATGEIGSLLITGESGVAAGIRRIEAVTGAGATALARERLDQLSALAGKLGAQSLDHLDAKVDELQGRAKDLQRQLDAAQARLAGSQAGDLAGELRDAGGVPLLSARVEAADGDALRRQLDALRERIPSGVIVLGTVADGAPRLVIGVSDDLVARGIRAGDLVRQLAPGIGGGGGGRPQLAEAGGKDAAGLDGALAAAAELVVGMGKG